MLRIRVSLDQEFDVGTEGTAVYAPWCLRFLGKTQRLKLGLPGGFFAERTWQFMLGLTWAVDQNTYMWAPLNFLLHKVELTEEL